MSDSNRVFKRRALKLLIPTLVAVAILGAAYWVVLSPHARALQINEKMVCTRDWREWFALLQELKQTVSTPVAYLRPQREHLGADVEANFVLAQRLVKDGSDDLMSGIADILKQQALDESARSTPAHYTEREMYFAERQAALRALSTMGKASKIAEEQLVCIVRTDPDTANVVWAAQALGGIGGVSCASALVLCLLKDDLEPLVRNEVLRALRSLGTLSAEDRISLKQQVWGSSQPTGQYAALALACVGDADAAGDLVSMLEGNLSTSDVRQIAAVLGGVPVLPDNAKSMLEHLAENGRPNVRDHAARILRSRTAGFSGSRANR